MSAAEGHDVPPPQQRNIAVVRKYFDGCSSGSLDDLLATLDPGVVHYFLAGPFKPIRGAEHLARHWRKFKRLLDPVWRIDRIVAQDDEVVSEWSCLWTPEGTRLRLMMRGSEWYVMRAGRIAEIRAYFAHSEQADTGLVDFPYGERDYLGRI